MNQFISTLLTFFPHLIISFPSIVYHGSYNLYLRKKSKVRYDTLPPGKHNVIIFVHGRGGHPTNFQYCIEQLKTHTQYHMLAFNLGRNFNSSIDQDVSTLRQYLEPLMDQINEIILIGLSKGGLTAIQYSILYPEKVRKIITVSSPLNGTRLANYHPFCKVTRENLGYGSNSIEEIKMQARYLPIYSIIPKYDHMIIPAKSAYYPEHGERCFFYTGKYSHVGILYAPAVINQIVQWVRE